MGLGDSPIYETDLALPSSAWTRTTVVIVSYNSAAILGACLDSLGPACKVVVVDNASADASVAIATRPHTTVIANPRNYGFGYACNQGAALAEGDFVLFLNPDARLNDADLAALVEASDRNDAALTAPLLADDQGRLELRMRAFGDLGNQSSADDIAPEGETCCAFITGAVLLWRLRDWHEIGGFDERIFLFWEDFDLCIRAAAAHKQMILVPAARALHLSGRSTPPSRKVRWLKDWHMTWGELYMHARHGSPATARAMAWAILRHHGKLALWAVLTLHSRRVYRNLAAASAAATFLRQSRAEPPALAAWNPPSVSLPSVSLEDA
jgi:N-acetylglucosaminyl-diphospho-decaprenol L-rhamnosyltransferase